MSGYLIHRTVPTLTVESTWIEAETEEQALELAKKVNPRDWGFLAEYNQTNASVHYEVVG